jgi:large subunit ribosomal protein L4e
MDMKSATLYGISGESKGTVRLAGAFSETVREDLIRKAVRFEKSRERQAYGTDKLAGKRTSAHYHGRRHARFSMMNREMARMKRIHGSGFLAFTARFVPQAVKGIKAHPPRSERVWKQDMNRKEYRKAVLSAVSASANIEIVKARGHKINGIKSLPIVLEDRAESIGKAKDFRSLLEKLGLSGELGRAGVKKVRAGKGTARGRKHRKRKGPMVVVSKESALMRAGRNIAGMDVVPLSGLKVDMLAPGAHPGRLTIWTKGAIEELKRMGA